MNNSETVDSEILSERMEAFKQYLVNEEKSDSTIEGYADDSSHRDQSIGT